MEFLETPVLIVGGGPVGLALANELGWRNIPCLLVDQNLEPGTFPTCESINARTMEHLRRWGLADELRSDGFPADYSRNVIFMTRVDQFEIARLNRLSNAESKSEHLHLGPEGSIWCPKYWFDPALKRHASRYPHVTIRSGCRLDAFTELSGSIEAELTDLGSDRRFKVRCNYLAACDGGGSGIRRQLGIKLGGTFAEGQNLGVFFRSAGVLERLPLPCSQIQILNEHSRATLSTVDGRELWRMTVTLDGLDSSAVQAERCIGEVLGPDIAFEIIATRPWAGHRVVAERFRKGRAFLVGDAAHMLWPRGGFGMNTGFGDAVDLGWKLAATLQGWGGEGLLESYQKERQPIAQRNVDEAARNRAADVHLSITPHSAHDTQAGANDRQVMRDQILRTRAKEWASLGIQLGYRYDGSTICIDDGTPSPPDDPTTYTPTARPGARAPHFWLTDTSSILDHFGKAFVLLVFDSRLKTDALSSAAARLRIPLDVIHVADDAAAELYECPLALVRPDGHVAWRGRSVQEPEQILGIVSGWTQIIQGTPEVVT